MSDFNQSSTAEGSTLERRHSGGPPPYTRQIFEAATKAVKRDDEILALEFTMNGGAPDRGGDICLHEGAQLDNFLRNPVMPWAHEHRGLPLGQWQDVRVRRGSLVGVGVFSSSPVWEFARTVAEMYRRKILRAVSVGFVPLKWRWREDRGDAIVFESYDLLECSAVMIGQHQDALATLSAARAAGIDLGPVVGEAEKVIQLGVASRGWLGLSDARRVVDELRAPRAHVDLGASASVSRQKVDLAAGLPGRRPKQSGLDHEVERLARIVERAYDAAEAGDVVDPGDLDRLTGQAVTAIVREAGAEIEKAIDEELMAYSGELRYPQDAASW